jgi:hypothetical protein
MRRTLRAQLTLGERAAVYAHLFLSFVLPPVGIALLVLGGGSTQPVGIGLLLVALVLIVVPISPILKAKVRRREERTSEN